MQVYYLVKVHLKKLFTTCIILRVKVKNRYIIYDWSIGNLFALSVKTSWWILPLLDKTGRNWKQVNIIFVRAVLLSSWSTKTVLVNKVA